MAMNKENVNSCSELGGIAEALKPYIDYTSQPQTQKKASPFGSGTLWLKKVDIEFRRSAYSSLFGKLKDCEKDDAEYATLKDLLKKLFPALLNDMALSTFEADDAAELSGSAIKLLGLYLHKCTNNCGLGAQQVRLLLERISEIVSKTKGHKQMFMYCAWLIGTQNLSQKFITREFETIIAIVERIIDEAKESASATFELLNAFQKLAHQQLALFSRYSKKWLEFAVNCMIHPSSEAIAKKSRAFLEQFVQTLASHPGAISVSISLAIKQFAKKNLAHYLECLSTGTKSPPHLTDMHRIASWRTLVCLFGADIAFGSQPFELLAAYIKPYLNASLVSTKRVALHGWALFGNSLSTQSPHLAHSKSEHNRLVTFFTQPLTFLVKTSSSALIFNYAVAVWLFLGPTFFNQSQQIYESLDTYLVPMLNVLLESSRPEASELLHKILRRLFSPTPILVPSTSNFKQKKLANLGLTLEAVAATDVTASLAEIAHLRGSSTFSAGNNVYLKAVAPKLCSIALRLDFLDYSLALPTKTKGKLAVWSKLVLHDLDATFKCVVKYKAEALNYLPYTLRELQASLAGASKYLKLDSGLQLCNEVLATCNQLYNQPASKPGVLDIACANLFLESLYDQLGDRAQMLLPQFDPPNNFGQTYLTISYISSCLLSSPISPDESSHQRAVSLLCESLQPMGSGYWLSLLVSLNQSPPLKSPKDSVARRTAAQERAVTALLDYARKSAGISRKDVTSIAYKADLSAAIGLLFQALCETASESNCDGALANLCFFIDSLDGCDSSEQNLELISCAIAKADFSRPDKVNFLARLLARVTQLKGATVGDWLSDRVLLLFFRACQAEVCRDADILGNLLQIVSYAPERFFELWCASLSDLWPSDCLVPHNSKIFEATRRIVEKPLFLERLAARKDSFWSKVLRSASDSKKQDDANAVDRKVALASAEVEASFYDAQQSPVPPTVSTPERKARLQRPLALTSPSIKRAFAIPQTSSPPPSILKKRTGDYCASSGSLLSPLSTSKRRKSVTFDMTYLDYTSRPEEHDLLNEQKLSAMTSLVEQLQQIAGVEPHSAANEPPNGFPPGASLLSVLCANVKRVSQRLEELSESASS